MPGRSAKPNGTQQNLIAERFGGWNLLLTPEHEIVEEALLTFERAGVKRHVLEGYKEFMTRPDDGRLVRDLAAIVAMAYRSHRILKKQNYPTNFDLDEEITRALDSGPHAKMRGISPDKLKNEILNNPDKYRFPG